MLKKHFVTFYSAGTFVAEQSTKPIESWSVDDAMAMAALITERHNAKPYGFRFTTRGRTDQQLDSKEIAKSPMHYIGGKVLTYREIEQRDDPRDRILLENMRCNRWDRVWQSTKGWSTTQPLQNDDIVVSA